MIGNNQINKNSLNIEKNVNTKEDKYTMFISNLDTSVGSNPVVNILLFLFIK